MFWSYFAWCLFAPIPPLRCGRCTDAGKSTRVFGGVWCEGGRRGRRAREGGGWWALCLRSWSLTSTYVSLSLRRCFVCVCVCRYVRFRSMRHRVRFDGDDCGRVCMRFLFELTLLLRPWRVGFVLPQPLTLPHPPSPHTHAHRHTLSSFFFCS